MERRVEVEVSDHVATVTMVRDDKHNALDGAMFTALVEAAAEVARTTGVRAVVLCGDGPSFCSGLDIAALAADGGLGDGSLFERGERRANLAQRVATDWLDLPVPVIAAIHGNCLGGGMQIALGADIRIAAPDAKLSIREIQWGLIPDMGISETLPPLMGLDVAKELAYTGRVVSGQEGQALGLVTSVAGDPRRAAQDLAREVAGRSPEAVRGVKRLFERAWRDGPQLALETELQLSLIGTPNQIAAATAGFSGGPAEFADPEPGVD